MNNDRQINLKVILAIIATGLLSFCGVIVETSMNVSFPTLMTEFEVNTATVQWMTTIYMLVVATIVPLSSALKRAFKTKTLFLVANVLFIMGLILDGIAPNFILLLLGRIIQGFGTGIALPLMFNIILEQVPHEKIGTMMGVGTLITAIAPAIGPTFGGLIVNSIGWRYIFAILIPILVISLVLGLVSIEQKSEILPASFDGLSILLIFFTFAGLILGFSDMGTYPLFSLYVLGAFLLGIIALSLFIRRSTVIDNPIINLSTFKNSRFTGHVASFFIFQVTTLGLSFALPNYIQLVNGNNATVAGLVVLPGAAVGAVFAPFAGRILDALGPRKPIMTGSILTVIAMLLFSLFALHLSNLLIAMIYIIIMIGAGLVFGNIMTNGLDQLDNAVRTDGNAILNTLQQFAGAVGTSVVAAIISASQASTSMAKSVSTAVGTQHAFYVLLIAVIIEFIILFVVAKRPRD